MYIFMIRYFTYSKAGFVTKFGNRIWMFSFNSTLVVPTSLIWFDLTLMWSKTKNRFNKTVTRKNQQIVTHRTIKAFKQLSGSCDWDIQFLIFQENSGNWQITREELLKGFLYSKFALDFRVIYIFQICLNR